MDIQTIFQIVAEISEMQPIEIVVWLVALALFVWLYKEFKALQQKKEAHKIAHTNKYMEYVSSSLSIAYQFKLGKVDIEDFYTSVFTCLPLFSGHDINKIRDILEADALEEEKVEDISIQFYHKLIDVSEDNKEFKSIKSIVTFFEYIFDKVAYIFLPIFQAAMMLILISVVLARAIVADNFYHELTSVTFLIVSLISVANVIHVIRNKKLKNKKELIIFMVIILISSLFLIFNVFVKTFLAIFIVTFLTAIIFRFRKK